MARHLTSEIPTEEDTFVALANLRVKFWLEDAPGSVGEKSWAELERFFSSNYGIEVPTKEHPLFLTPNYEYSHMLIMVGQLLGRLRQTYDSIFIFFIHHEHGY